MVGDEGADPFLKRTDRGVHEAVQEEQSANAEGSPAVHFALFGCPTFFNRPNPFAGCLGIARSTGWHQVIPQLSMSQRGLGFGRE